MSKFHPPGTLVRVRNEALSVAAEHSTVNRDFVREHGYLYFITCIDEDGDEDNPGVQHIQPDIEINAYLCRSLATGKQDIAWFHNEIEAAEGAQPDDQS